MREWIARQFCKWGHCTECRVYETEEGIGGKCIRCGTVYGWMTSALVRAVADRDIAALAGDWATLGLDLSRAAEKLQKEAERG